jgi:tetratricopeptide (TPR) repeat protein
MDSDKVLIRLGQVISIFLLYFAAAFALNQPGFNSAMIYDSAALIERKAHLFAQSLTEVLRIVPARPLFMTSLYANYQLAGMDPYFFRLFNAGILAAAGAALTLMILLILSLSAQPQEKTRGRALAVAVFLGLLFVVHPLQNFVVLYIWQREAILACFFYFLAVAAYLGVRSGRLSSTVPGLVLVGALFFAGLLTKENAITLPLMLVLAELFLFRQSRRELVGRAVSIAAIALPPLLIYLFLTWSLHAPGSQHPEGVLNRLLVHYSFSGLTFFQVLLTESRVFFSYLFSTLAPFWTRPQLIEAQIVSTSVVNPPATIAACAGTLLLLALAVKYRSKRPVEAFGIFFYFLALVPESLFIPQFLFFGYRPILAMAGVLMVLGSVILSLLKVWETKRREYRFSIVATGLILTVLFGLQTFRQASRWNSFNFWSDEYSRLPAFSERVEQKPYWAVVVNFSGELVKKGRKLEAIETLKKSMRLSPGMQPVMAVLGEAPEAFTGVAMTTKDPPNARVKIPRELLVNLGLALRQSGKLKEADSIYAFTHNDLGMAFQESGNMKLALEHYRRALALRPDFPEALCNLGNSLREVGDLAQSAEYLRKAIELRPNYAQAIEGLGYTLLMSGKYAEAIVNFKKVLEADPRNADVHNALGAALAGQGETEQARAHFRAALDIDPGHSGAQHNLRALKRNPAQ